MIFLAGLLIAALCFFALLNIIRTTIKTAVFVALIIVGMSIFFGIRSDQIWVVVFAIAEWGMDLLQRGWEWVQSSRQFKMPG